jgi:N-acetylglucosamine-6-sulfatase
MRTSRTISAGLAALTVALASFAVLAPGPHGRIATAVTNPQPDVLLILTDDQRWDQLSHMPTVQQELVGKGMRFDQAFVVNSLCCPSRATILTGRYSHSTGVYKNQMPYGGFSSFKRGKDANTLPVWLDQAGYRTALIGKYMNAYNDTHAFYKPPGWDGWQALTSLDKPGRDYYHYSIAENKQLTTYGTAGAIDEADYMTDVLADRADAFIRSTPATTPMFLAFWPWGPHKPSTPPARYLNALPNFQGIRPPNLNEADVSDKPAWVQALAKGTNTYDAQRKREMQNLLAVDDAVAQLLTALADTGRLQDTLIVFASDNGTSGRSHRWGGKMTVWEEAIRIPLVMRYDPITGGIARVDDAHLALNLDFAPTIADLAGVTPVGAEGTSLMPFLDGTPPASWRDRFLIEHLTDGKNPPSYCAVRTTRYKYVRYATGEEELYDLQTDPFELQSRHADPAMASVLEELRADTVAMCSPPPPGYTF